jgi:hypothetical protein
MDEVEQAEFGNHLSLQVAQLLLLSMWMSHASVVVLSCNWVGRVLFYCVCVDLVWALPGVCNFAALVVPLLLQNMYMCRARQWERSDSGVWDVLHRCCWTAISGGCCTGI